MFRFIKWLLAIIAIVIIGAFVALRIWQAEKGPQGKTDLSFRSVDLPFIHKADLTGSLPFLGSAAFDLDGDGLDELFLGGGDDQADKIFEFNEGRFEALPVTLSKAGSDATHGAASMDIDNDGDVDLFTARESGIWFHENDNGALGSVNLNLPIAENTTPLSIGFGDINKDGLADMYVAGYLKIERVEGETNFSNGYGGYSHLFLNKGNGNWQDISKTAGVWRQHNTFIGLFADLDNDLDSDLVIAQDTGKVEMYENTGAQKFSPIPNPSEYSYPMGVAAGDYDNDGLIDLYFSNVGYTLPPAILRGNLDADDVFNPAYMLFHNNGGLTFTDQANEMNADRYGFGWGIIFADMNLDGREDILAAQNYARFPANQLLAKYPGKILLNYGDRFEPVEKTAGAPNTKFGIAPIVSDFNGDGWPDLVWANLDGPSLAYINSGADRNWVKVKLPNTASSINARVTVTNGDRTQTRQFLTSQGMGSDQGRDMIFGIGNAISASVKVEFQNGEIDLNSDIPAGTILEVAAK